MGNQPSKLFFVLDHFIPWKAGTEHQLTMLLEGLPGEWQVTIVVFRESEWLQKHAARLRADVKLFRVDNFRALSSYRNILKLVGFLRREKPDIVHTFFPVANIIGVIAARMAGVKRIISSRRDFGEWMSPRYLTATRFANRFVNGVVTNSQQVRKLTHEVEGLPYDRIHVIANGIEVDRFLNLPDRESCRVSLGISRHQIVVGLVANFRPMKRQETLVRAAKILADEYPDSRYFLIGTNATEDDIRSRLQSLVEELGLAGVVIFDHSEKDIRDYLAAFDVGVNCSEGEGLSNAIMEYMASGLPCVVTDSGGNTDLITDGKDGMMFELDNPADLARHLAELFDSPEERRRLGSSARDTIVGRYSVEAMVGNFVEYYSDAR